MKKNGKKKVLRGVIKWWKTEGSGLAHGGYDYEGLLAVLPWWI